MPVYEYECARGHRYEKRESFGAPAEQPCERPRCKALAKRVLIPPQVHFKGSGWYKTDSRSSSGPPLKADADYSPPPSAASQAEADMAPRPPEIKK